ncbi:nucleoid-associated protein [Anaerophilus nitritogenes]|uniref:nucleoid-associated protein n=1 Tax=Anaerophilus nitritogenes TaxID=2498136 RepID=UPI0013EB5791|nr:nucleoid-associated protein [Anaerophilus nitritogenes]
MVEEIKMKNFGDIYIKSAILHIIDNKQDDKPELSDLELDLSSEKSYDFLKSHIKESLLDSKNLKAKFNDPSENSVLKCYNNIVNDEKNFVDASKKITERLFKFMGKKASNGCLIVCSYKDEKSNEFLAILKMDYNNYYIFERITTNEGKMYNKLITKSDGLPSIKEKLQKCAFIKMYNDNNEYDLLVLDKQRKRYHEDDVSQFFYKFFLNCNFNDNIRKNTKNLLKYTKKFIEKTYGSDPVLAKEKISILYDTFNSSKTFNAKNFSQLVFEEEEIKEKFIEEVIMKNDLEIETEIDNGYTKNKTNQISYKATEGLEIKVPAKLVKDKKVFEIKKSQDNPGTYNISIKNIHLDSYDLE